MNDQSNKIQHVFIIGAKSIGQYGGFEAFVEGLVCEHENDNSIKYHIACKANGEGYMDETLLSGISIIKTNDDGSVAEFEYKSAHVFKIPCPDIGSCVAIYYDRAASDYSINYCKENHIDNPVFYILTCRIGLFINGIARRIHAIGGRYYLNPDGHEWKRSKWTAPVRMYWKWSEKKMVKRADLIICDSAGIEKYIQAEYAVDKPKTVHIAYGVNCVKSEISDDDYRITDWLNEIGIRKNSYYLVVGRFVPENNYETMIREFMRSNSQRDLVLITNYYKYFMDELESKLHFKEDSRIKFAGTVYDCQLLKKIREYAYGYLHGHEVGGTNPSLLEAMVSTDINLLLDVEFNREVALEAALYWDKGSGSLANLIDRVDRMDIKEKEEYGRMARNRIETSFSWKLIGEKYKSVWEQ